MNQYVSSPADSTFEYSKITDLRNISHKNDIHLVLAFEMAEEKTVQIN